MDDDLARAIALSLESSKQISNNDPDLELALRLSMEMPKPDMLSASSSKKRKGSEIVEILSSDEEDIDSDLKLAIELSKENKGRTQQEVIVDMEQTIALINEDRDLALRLQNDFDRDIQQVKENTVNHNMSENARHLCSPEWETIDPNPDIHSLFVQFDKRFFWSSLGSVELEWSKRMYTCAGICYYQKRGPFERCNIRLSQPLLALRSRGDLVNTLIHEMIHAFLFVTHNDRDRDGHGPRFQGHAARINQQAGTNITIYHDWHEETDYYKKHIWRCNGPCRTRKPFLGFVKRVSNRAPGPNDRWWSQHKSSCNGVFEKIGEPTPRKKKNEPKKAKTEKSTKIALANKSKIRSPDQATIDAWVKPPHVKLNEKITIDKKELSPKTTRIDKENFGTVNILGGRRDGISRLLFPNGKKPEKQSKKIITAKGKQYKLSDFFSSDDE